MNSDDKVLELENRISELEQENLELIDEVSDLKSELESIEDLYKDCAEACEMLTWVGGKKVTEDHSDIISVIEKGQKAIAIIEKIQDDVTGL